MTFTKLLLVLFILNSFENGVYGGKLNEEEAEKNTQNVTKYNGSRYKKSLLGDFEEKNLEHEILKELNRLSFRKQREIFVDLKKQHAKFNIPEKSLISSESEILSPLNVEELKNIRKSIKASVTSLPAVRNKRTLNLLLNLVARAMGYTLTLSNTDAEWIPRREPPQPSAQPCSTPPSPCRPSSSPPSTPPPCSVPPTTPPCPGSGASRQPATVPPNQINANTVSYPYRPARTIPLFNFAPLPAGIRVPYPPLLQPPAQNTTPCTPPQQPTTPSPCSSPAPSIPPCGTTPAPPNLPPLPSASSCTSPTPQPPPCSSSTPAPKQQPCATTTPPPPPPCTNPTPTPPPSFSPPPSSPPCSPPEVGPSKPAKKGSFILEYDDPVRIEIFSNDKKYLPASGKIYSGHYENHQQDWHSHFFPSNENNKYKDNDFEEEEMQEEHVEEEEESETPEQLHHYEEEDERNSANSEDEEDESETNLSVVKRPLDREVRKTERRKSLSSKTKLVTTIGEKKNENEDKKNGNKEKTQKMKKPKKKKWVRIVKKQRRTTKMDSNPLENFQVNTSDSVPQGTRNFPKIYREGTSRRDSHSYDVSDFPNGSGSRSAENVGDFRTAIINKEQIHSSDLVNAYEFNVNPYTHALEPEEARRAKLEKAVEKYVEDYVEKQLGQELIKNTGIPKTTVFEFAPKNGPKIQTITTTVAKTSRSGPTRQSTSARPIYRNLKGNSLIAKQSNYEQTLKKHGNPYETLTRKF